MQQVQLQAFQLHLYQQVIQICWVISVHASPWSVSPTAAPFLSDN